MGRVQAGKEWVGIANTQLLVQGTRRELCPHNQMLWQWPRLRISPTAINSKVNLCLCCNRKQTLRRKTTWLIEEEGIMNWFFLELLGPEGVRGAKRCWDPPVVPCYQQLCAISAWHGSVLALVCGLWFPSLGQGGRADECKFGQWAHGKAASVSVCLSMSPSDCTAGWLLWAPVQRPLWTCWL